MNRSIAPAIPLILTIAVLTGCGQGEQPPQAAPSSPEDAAAQPATTAATATATMSRFTEADAALAAGGVAAPCAIDKINSQLATHVVNVAGSEVRIEGWISDPSLAVPADFDVLLVGDGVYRAPGKAGVRRPDVAKALGSPALANAGFNLVASMGEVPAGEYSMSLIQGDGAQAARCDTKARVAVVDSPD